MEYLVKVGLNYPDGKGGERRAEPGEKVTDLPDAETILALVAAGVIEPLGGKEE